MASFIYSLPVPNYLSENRLISTTVGTTTTTYQYDSQSRRIAKTSGGTTTVYVYDGWNLIAQYVAGSLTKSYTWGMDLSGSMQGAGGVGGLLAVEVGTGGSPVRYYPTYDGNGNISEYLDGAGAVQAHYEYDAFGKQTVSLGSLAATFEYRFSTKPLDSETGMYYYGYRYYDANTGRWPSRDTIGEWGGVNLYAFVKNLPIKYTDYLGKKMQAYIHGSAEVEHKVWNARRKRKEIGDYAILGQTESPSFPTPVASCDGCKLKIGDFSYKMKIRLFDQNDTPPKLDNNGLSPNGLPPGFRVSVGNPLPPGVYPGDTLIPVVLEYANSGYARYMDGYNNGDDLGLSVMDHERRHERIGGETWNDAAGLANLAESFYFSKSDCCWKGAVWVNNYVIFQDAKKDYLNAVFDRHAYGISNGSTGIDEPGSLEEVNEAYRILAISAAHLESARIKAEQCNKLD